MSIETKEATVDPVQRYLELRGLIGQVIDDEDEREKMEEDAAKHGVSYGFHKAGALIALMHDRGFLADGIPDGIQVVNVH